ncbi:MAG: response regulator [Burkholderiales bacterium]|nr:response regulator [Burkholderiales bacterium]
MSYILIVDDHSDIRRLLSISLCKEFTVKEAEAEDGVTALETARHDHPKIILLDVMMPGEMDGMQVLDAIKSDPKTSGILVAMISARAQTVDHDEARRRGADAYFIKPFSPLQVVAWVRSHMT